MTAAIAISRKHSIAKGRLLITSRLIGGEAMYNYSVVDAQVRQSATAHPHLPWPATAAVFSIFCLPSVLPYHAQSSPSQRYLRTRFLWQIHCGVSETLRKISLLVASWWLLCHYSVHQERCEPVSLSHAVYRSSFYDKYPTADIGSRS